METAVVISIIDLIEKVVQNEPEIAAEFQKLFSTGNPTPADFEAMRIKRLGQSFESLCPDAKLPEATPALSQADPATSAPALTAAPVTDQASGAASQQPEKTNTVTDQAAQAPATVPSQVTASGALWDATLPH